ncbi:hypothetical protein CAPTEDRAFT_93861 [Capitella teleta]|uniref:Galactosyltransferase C-terminal domain-containing protein n=1 Tax=Capitella teleta TaxID=283909 RepID=R7UVQ7_CAPTE|nr:hypothetical protein CAPTEDRAFT_93861 [Capitella teleta]|eukprot:ELU08027.1 hypothetical protein CAPTEDRAFT_93861 [Capitella teleta]
MDILNPFGQQASGNKTYDFDDYFDYKDFSEPEIDEQHSLAVIVPFRNAHAELGRFLSHMHTFLRAQNISHVFYIVEQDDSLRFNRGSLINVGFLEAQRDRQSDYFVMHDIDILPLNPRLSYRFDGCAKGPLHLASPSLHPHYSKIDFIGAVLLMTNEQYLKVNGMSNVFWGWGREDEELRIRLRIAGIKIFRPSGVNSTKADSFLHIHNEATRKRDRLIIGDQYKARYRLDTVTGLNTTKYKLLEKVTKELNGVPYAHVRVQLDCNHRATPWCQRQ